MLKIDTANWMSKLNANLSLTDLSIPGTHDSGTYVKHELAAYAQCQNHDFKTQLNDGIRFFDIRINGTLHIVHGSGTFGYVYDLTLSDVLKTFKSFLETHSGETILMSVKADDDKTEAEKNFAKEIKNFDTIFLKKSSIPTLAEAKGKIVLFNRLHFSEFGIPWTSWKDNAVFSINNNGNEFYIEDGYEKEYHDTHKKLKVIEDTLKKAIKSQNKKIFFVTFCSIGTEAVHTPQMYAQGGPGIDPAINQAVFDYVKKDFENKRFGLVILDFYKTAHGNNYLVETIIKSNPESDSIYISPKQTLVATVVSEPNHQSGQKHRSSGNFSTDSMPSNTIAFLFKVKATNTDVNQIHFDVMEDKSAAADPTIFSNDYNNKEETSHIKKYRNLYIANPSKTNNHKFTVEVYALS